MDWKTVVDELARYLVEDWEDYNISFADGLDFVEDFARSKDIDLGRQKIEDSFHELGP